MIVNFLLSIKKRDRLNTSNPYNSIKIKLTFFFVKSFKVIESFINNLQSILNALYFGSKKFILLQNVFNLTDPSLTVFFLCRLNTGSLTFDRFDLGPDC